MIAIHFIMTVDGLGFTNKNERTVREKASFVAGMQNDESLSLQVGASTCTASLPGFTEQSYHFDVTV